MKKVDGVFEGGGMKIFGLLGAYEAVDARGFKFSHVAGSSAGAIVAAGIAAGYTPGELKQLIMNVDFKKFKDGGSWFGKRGYNILRHLGFYKGDYFESFMERVLAAKGVLTFGDLLSPDPADSRDGRYRWTLKVIAADLTLGRMVILPNDAPLYGLKADDFPVARAIRMSMSIPFFFQPVKLDGSYIVDGGLLSNFPIDVFDADGAPDWPTFGVLLKEDTYGKKHKIRGPVSFFKAMFNTMMKFHDRAAMRPEDFLHRTIAVPTGKTETTNFNISTKEKKELYDSGRQAAIQFLDRWSWPEYLAWSKKVRGVKDEGREPRSTA